MERKIAWLVMLLIPIPLFISPSSAVVFASGTIGDDALAFPLSFFLTPLIIVISIKNIKCVKGASASLVALLAAFSAWVTLLSFASATRHPVSLVYASQWMLIFFWGNYFLSSLNRYSLRDLARPFFYGAFSGAAYIFLSGMLELALYGALLDSGRMTQNLVLKGQYQLYVYTPTLLAVSFLVVLTLYKSGHFPLSRFWFYIYLSISLIALLLTGAREGLLVFLLGGGLICFVRSMLSMLVAAFILAVVLIGFYFNFEAVLQFFAASDLRVLNKIARLAEDGAALGSRDIMMANYLRLIDRDYMLGLMLLPPELAYPDAGVDIKSAHNFYIDVWAWTGFPGLVLFVCFVLLLFFIAFGNILKHALDSQQDQIAVGFSWIVLIVLLVSNNINVPLRQPAVVPVFMLCVFFMLHSRESSCSFCSKKLDFS